MARKSARTLLPFEGTLRHCAHRGPHPYPWLPQPAHDRHVCFKDLPSSQPSGQLLHPDLQSIDKGGLELKYLTPCSLFATPSTLMPFQAHHLLHLPHTHTAWSPNQASGLSLLQAAILSASPCSLPCPLALHSPPHLPGFLGSP